MATDDEQPAPSIAEILRHHGITPCSKCHGEGFIRARTPMLEMTAGCGHCDGTGEEPKCRICGGSGRIYEIIEDGPEPYWRDDVGRVPFPCACVMAKEGVAPRVRNNVSMDRANPGDADMKGKTP